MIRTKSIIVTLIGALLVASLAWLLYSSIEFYEETENSQWSIDAIRNPYLAAQKFLVASGMEIVETDSLIKLETLEGVSTLLITEASQVSQPRQLDSVLSWLTKGGSLIVTANDFSTDEDLLLAEFGIDVDFPKSDDSESDEDSPSISESLRQYNEKIEQGMTPAEIAQSGLKEVSLTEIDFGDDIGKLEIHFNPNRILTHAYVEGTNDNPRHKPFSWSSSEYGVHMIQFDVGEGLLSIISDPSIWQSRNIDSYDHAYLLWVLSSSKSKFALLRSIRRDSLWSLVSSNAYEFLIALACFTIFCLWYSGQRFGRIVPLENQKNRALSEHFSATAGYLWHRNAIDTLLKPMRQEIFRRAHTAIPAFARADRNTRLDLIARHCKLDQQTVSRILQSDKLNESTFVSTVKLLKQIEQSL
ncbi:MAG: DUF4350 domain-containing protein [Gammaproteobacteria bacterium]|nr:DUF4350 domain-containing protein [Gammaproteobacteria bacterium]